MPTTLNDMFLESCLLIKFENGRPVLDENGNHISIAADVRPDTSEYDALINSTSFHGTDRPNVSKETYHLTIKNISMEDYRKIVGLDLTNMSEITLIKT